MFELNMPGLFIMKLKYVCKNDFLTHYNHNKKKMRKIVLLTFPVLFSFFILKAQSYKTVITFQKNQYPVAAIQVPYEEDVVTDAIKEYMLGKGFKDTHYKDFIVFRSVPIDKNGSVLSDAYFNINKKNHSEKDITIINLLPVKKGETLSTATEEDSTFVNSSAVFLDSMTHQILTYSIQKQIKAQQKTVDKIKSKLISLKNDSGDIAKKIRNYESSLSQNKTDQAKQTQLTNGIATGDQEALSKAHKKMDKLLDDQTDYEKKIRNYKADLDQNTADRQTQQTLYDKDLAALDALKQRLQNIK